MSKVCKQKLIFLDVCNGSDCHFSWKPRGIGAKENSIAESSETAFYFKLNIVVPQYDAKIDSLQGALWKWNKITFFILINTCWSGYG